MILKPRYNVCMIANVASTTIISQPWFIIETHGTADGMRTRIVDGRYSDLSAAMKRLEHLESLAEIDFSHVRTTAGPK
jgi:hypothetical protein